MSTAKRQVTDRPAPRKRFRLPDLEITLEERCVGYVEKLGGEAPKIAVPNKPGFPDRTIFLPMTRFVSGALYVEFKRRGEKPTALQEGWHRRLVSYGAEVWVIDDYGTFVRWIDERRLKQRERK